MSVDTESVAEARSILAKAQEVCQDLGIKWIPDKVIFSDVYLAGDTTKPRTQPNYLDVPSDHPVMMGDTLAIAPSMKGRLSPEEWRPIIAASMIYYSKLNTRKNLGIIIIVTPILLAIGAGLLTLLLSGFDFYNFILLLVGAYLLVTLGSFLLVARYEKGLWLKADRKAADYVGPQLMLGILEKVNGFKISEIEGGRASTMPSLTQRIASLSQYTQAASTFSYPNH